MRIFGTIARHPGFFRLGMRMGSIATHLFAKKGWLNTLPPPLNGWTDHRAFRALAKKSFRQLWTERRTTEYPS
jgi:hypothetical protein